MPAPNVSPDLPPVTWRLLLRLLGGAPQGALSRSFGWVADRPIPRAWRRAVLGSFARAVGIDLSEAEKPLHDYETLNAFFVRRLRPGLRSWPAGERVLASPVDGVAGQVGRVREGRVVQAKGHLYSAAELLGDEEEARRFEGGWFATIYLSPRHYHRIHAPCGGAVPLARHIPGALLPVNAPAVAHLPNLFARNERLLCYLDGPLGRVALVAVGAYNVGRISTAFDPEWNAPEGRGSWVTNRRGTTLATHRYDPAIHMRMGDEIMAFHLGSTVVMLLEPDAPALRADLRPGVALRLGEALTE